MKKIFFALFIISIIVSGCSPAETVQVDLNATAASMAQATMTAEAAKQATTIPDTATPEPAIQPTQMTDATLPSIVASTSTTPPDDSTPCLAAQLTDETYADGTYLTPGSTFTQTWVLRNVGSCAWTDEYSFILHHGSDGTPDRYAVGYVAPGKATTFSVTYIAPYAGASENSLSSFWSIQSPDGLLFGAAGYQYFWVNVKVAGATPTSKVRDLVASGYSYRSNGGTSPDIVVGDTGNDYISEAYITFDFGNIPSDAVVTSAYLDIWSNTTTNSNPFGDLGCLIISETNSGTQLWRMCSKSEMQNSGYASSAVLNYIQSAIASNGALTMTLTFSTGSDNDSIGDNLYLRYPILNLDWYKP